MSFGYTRPKITAGIRPKERKKEKFFSEIIGQRRSPLKECWYRKIQTKINHITRSEQILSREINRRLLLNSPTIADKQKMSIILACEWRLPARSDERSFVDMTLFTLIDDLPSSRHLGAQSTTSWSRHHACKPRVRLNLLAPPWSTREVFQWCLDTSRYILDPSPSPVDWPLIFSLGNPSQSYPHHGSSFIATADELVPLVSDKKSITKMSLRADGMFF